jgi:hypothetical protein
MLLMDRLVARSARSLAVMLGTCASSRERDRERVRCRAAVAPSPSTSSSGFLQFSNPNQSE